MNDKDLQRLPKLCEAEDMLSDIVYSFLPDAEGLYGLSLFGDEYTGRDLLIVEMNLLDESIMGLVIGKKKRNVLMILSWLRSQQIYPLSKNASIIMNISMPGGRIKRFEFDNATCQIVVPDWAK